MSKIQRFKTYISEAPAADYVAPKDDDEEVKDYKPRSKGEQEFKDKHGAAKVTEYPGKDRQDGASKVKTASQPKGKSLKEDFLNKAGTGRSKEGYHDAGQFSKQQAQNLARKHGGKVTADSSGKYLVKLPKGNGGK